MPEQDADPTAAAWAALSSRTGAGSGLQPHRHHRCPQDKAKSWQPWPALPSSTGFQWHLLSLQ